MALAPAIVSITPADTWVLVAANVVNGVIWIYDLGTSYKQTFVLAGAAAPSDDSTAINFINCFAEIDSDEPIDVYVKAVTIAGSVRVDL